MYEYQLAYGTYYLVDKRTQEKLYGMDEVAICFSCGFVEDGQILLLKHGSPENVQKYFKEKVSAYESLGARLRVVTGKFPVDELNKILSTTGYLERFLKKYNLTGE